MRKISVSRYIVVAIITFAVFIVGILVGLLIEDKRLSYTENDILKQKIDTSSLQLQYIYLNSLDISECDVLNVLFMDSLKALDNSMKRVRDYEEKSLINRERFELLSREFILEEIRYWLLARQIKETCNEDIVSTLSFFMEECKECERETFMLEHLKKVFGEKFLLFHFNVDIEEPLIQTLTKQYNITEYPTVIIENKKIEGLSSLDDLIKVTCSFYRDKPKECS